MTGTELFSYHSCPQQSNKIGIAPNSQMGKPSSKGRSQSLELLDRELKIAASDPVPSSRPGDISSQSQTA